ncbi:MAG TPA: Gfo/Idh/MocA family oxidoreductase [Candidatus Sumerlaeota bacterium]|nr:Gfo/Idh/MocA family oxidoreductase [Candidatus Sumerlaeota bacterium]
MKQDLNRRSFMKGLAVLAGVSAFSTLGSFSFGEEVRKPKPRKEGDKIRLAAIGGGGKGEVDIDGAVTAGAVVVALCDVDESRCKAMREKYPSAKFYKDFRKMLTEMDAEIDAVTVSTPDHMHFPAAKMAIEMGKHVYVQKPLTHCIWEAQELRRLVEKHGVVSQMGNQGHASDGVRQVREWVQAGVIGDVTEAHIWTNRPVWPQGMKRPAGKDPVREGLDWNLWLGVAPERPFQDKWPAGTKYHDKDIKDMIANQIYAPFNWRGYWDFGTGALGDMGCHIMDAAFWALDIKEAMIAGQDIEVEAESAGMTEDMGPDWEIVKYSIPARGKMPACKLTWYSGGKKPPRPKDLEEKAELSIGGNLMYGTKGTIYDTSDYCDSPRLIPYSLMKERNPIKNVPKTIPRAPKNDPYCDWVEAIKKGDPHLPGSNILDYASYLSEFVVLGNLAIRTKKKIVWNSKECTVKNAPEAMQYVKKTYRKF